MAEMDGADGVRSSEIRLYMVSAGDGLSEHTVSAGEVEVNANKITRIPNAIVCTDTYLYM